MLLFQFQRERAVCIDSSSDNEKLYNRKMENAAPYTKTLFQLGEKLQHEKWLFTHLSGYKAKTELDKSLISGIFTTLVEQG